MRDLPLSIGITFAVAFVVSAFVIAVWNVIAQGRLSADWELALRFGLIFGFALPIVEALKKRSESR